MLVFFIGCFEELFTSIEPTVVRSVYGVYVRRFDSAESNWFSYGLEN